MHKYSQFVLILIIYIFLSQISFSQSYSILALGNSVTQADNTHFSYRYALWQKLIDDGVNFDYVGSMTDHYNCGTPSFPDYNGNSFDTDHEGHWGWRCDQILNGGSSSNCAGPGNLSLWLNNYTPDITLIHLGTNDMFQHQPVETTINEIDTIISRLRNSNPNVIILLAKLIPSTITQLQTRILWLNAEIPNVAVTMADPNSPIIIVDQFTGFDALLDTQSDGVHPNELGEEKMAQKWRDAIQSVIAAPTGLHLDLSVILGGAYDNSGIQRVNPYLEIGAQPFNQSPWNYAGLEEITAVPSDMVDWVLVELRDAASPSVANAATLLARKACVLRNDGQILNDQGETDLFFDVELTSDLFVVIYHPNHLPVMSLVSLAENTGIYSYDFSSSSGQAYGGIPAMFDFSDGFYGMIPGDYNQDGTIDDFDKSLGWEPSTGYSGYLKADLNLDGEVNNIDKNDFHIVNLGKSSFVP